MPAGIIELTIQENKITYINLKTIKINPLTAQIISAIIGECKTIEIHIITQK
jgi:hypothetical protein